MALHVRERRALEITGRDQEATAENKGGVPKRFRTPCKTLGLVFSTYCYSFTVNSKR